MYVPIKTRARQSETTRCGSFAGFCSLPCTASAWLRECDGEIVVAPNRSSLPLFSPLCDHSSQLIPKIVYLRFFSVLSLSLPFHSFVYFFRAWMLTRSLAQLLVYSNSFVSNSNRRQRLTTISYSFICLSVSVLWLLHGQLCVNVYEFAYEYVFSSWFCYARKRQYTTHEHSLAQQSCVQFKHIAHIFFIEHTMLVRFLFSLFSSFHCVNFNCFRLVRWLKNQKGNTHTHIHSIARFAISLSLLSFNNKVEQVKFKWLFHCCCAADGISYIPNAHKHTCCVYSHSLYPFIDIGFLFLISTQSEMSTTKYTNTEHTFRLS